jgi:ABC-type transport system substrate-binding protein
MEIRPVERSVWYDAYRSADFDATIWDVPNVPQWLLDRDFFGEGTRIGYRNPEIVRLLKTLTAELDPTVQDTLYAQINEMLRRDMPVTFLFPYVESIAAHRRIQGVGTSDRANLLAYIADLWIEEDSR